MNARRGQAALLQWHRGSGNRHAVPAQPVCWLLRDTVRAW